jgi:KUP system potassium uptake protein
MPTLQPSGPRAAHPPDDSRNGAAAPIVPARVNPRRLLVLSLASLGIVYGDIGTSPLYAMRECFHGAHAIAVTPANVLGVLSLILWSLILVISIKYLVLILRADHRGEGGILALATLVTDAAARSKVVLMLGLFGAALLYADGMITPAITVTGAIEGLSVVTPLFTPAVVPISIAILVAVFIFQSRGTTAVGKVFGPATLVWFAALSALGIYQILRAPEVLVAANPLHAFQFIVNNRWHAFVVLGAVFLVVTGGEALYADIGHFGTGPVRLAWFTVVLPGLMLNYFGQGALLFLEPDAAVNPFYRMAPAWALYPLVALATAAAVIASQAVISGAFSLTMQAIQLGYSPRLRVQYTSAQLIGQIYVPAVNWALMIACIALVVAFGSSTSMAAAYGVAITTTMLITTVLFYLVARRRWHWPAAVAIPVTAFFIAIDLAFFGSNMIKLAHGGWVPLAIAGLILFLMLTWRKGRQVLSAQISALTLPLDVFLADCGMQRILRVPGTAVYMSGSKESTPLALLHNLKHNKVLHHAGVVLTVITEELPYVATSTDRAVIEKLRDGFWRVRLRYGFMEKPDVPAALSEICERGLEFDPMKTTYFIGRETVLATDNPAFSSWRGTVFAWMTRNTGDVTSYFGLPPNGVVELGARVEV